MNDKMRIPFTYGTYGGLAVFAYFILIYFTGFSPLWKMRVFGMWIPIFIILKAVYEQMIEFRSEGLSFKSAFLSGLVAFVTMASLRGMLVYMFIQFVDPSIIDTYINEAISDYQKMGAISGSDTADQAIAMLESKRHEATAMSVAAGDAWLYLLGGIPISLFAALLFNRNPQKNV